MDIFKRDLAGEIVSVSDSEFYKIETIIAQTQEILAELNLSYHAKEEIQEIFSRLTGHKVDKTFELLAPFYTDFGRNISVGKNVFINQNCTLMDRGGITLDDNVLLAPCVKLITTNHVIAPKQRRSVVSMPIHICKNVWIGTGASVMPGVTIGENSIVCAGAVVTKDVAKNVMVAGIPAKKIKNIQEEI